MPEIWTTSAVEEAIADHRVDLHRLNGAVEQYGAHAEQARALARDLTATVAPLRSLFDGIRSAHTPATWEGNAATQSRSRLDTHEIRTAQAVRQIDALIDELTDRAYQLEQQRNAGLDQIEDIRWQLAMFQGELARPS